MYQRLWGLKMRSKYSDIQSLFLLENYKGKTIRELTDRFNNHFGTKKSYVAIGQWLRYRNLNFDMAKVNRVYSEEELTFVYVNRDLTNIELTRRFNDRFGGNITLTAIKNVKKSRGWQKNVRAKKHSPRRITVGKRNIRLDYYVWECVNDPLPPGYTILHLDNDPENNKIENLKLVTNEICHAYAIRGFSKAPGVLAPALYAQTMLRHAIKQRLEGLRDE